MLSFFFPSLVYLTGDGHTRALTNRYSLAGRILVLPSQLYIAALRRAPRPDHKGQQAACLQLAVEHGLPHPDAVSQVFSTDIGFSRILCFAWSRERVKAYSGGLPARVIPEALARRGLDSGVRLVHGLDGYEGEIWARGMRVAHQWWPEPPDETDWRLFLNGARTLGLEDMPDDYLSSAVPEPEAPAWRRRLTWVNPSWRARLTQVSPPALAGLGATVLAAPILAALIQTALLSHEAARASSHLSELRAASSDWIDLRREALDASGFIDKASAAGDAMGLIYALLDLQTALEGRTSLSRLSFRDGEIILQLRSVEGMDTLGLVQKLEAGPGWHDVRIDAQKNELRARLNLELSRSDGPS